MNAPQLAAILSRLGFTSDDGEDFGDTARRHVRFRAPRVTEGTVAVLWHVAGSAVPQRRVIPFAEVEALLMGEAKAAQ